MYLPATSVRQHFLAIVMDNATSNDALARTLATLLVKYDIHFDPKDGQIRCLPHVVNLVVQKILSVLAEAFDEDFNSPPDPDEEDQFQLNRELPLHYDPDGDPVQKALDTEFQNDPPVPDGEEVDVNDETESDDGLPAGSDAEDDWTPNVTRLKSPIVKVCTESQLGISPH